MSTWFDINPPSVEEASVDVERIPEFEISDRRFVTELRRGERAKRAPVREKILINCDAFTDLLITEL